MSKAAEWQIETAFLETKLVVEHEDWVDRVGEASEGEGWQKPLVFVDTHVSGSSTSTGRTGNSGIEAISTRDDTEMLSVSPQTNEK